MQAIPIGGVQLLVTFGELTNFCKELLTFEVVDFPGTYHKLLGWPNYAKFMAVPHRASLKLKIPGPHGVITMDCPGSLLVQTGVRILRSRSYGYH
jgi:hypothetical protein